MMNRISGIIVVLWVVVIVGFVLCGCVVVWLSVAVMADGCMVRSTIPIYVAGHKGLQPKIPPTLER